MARYLPDGSYEDWSVAELLRIETRLAGRSAAPPIEDERPDL